MSDLDDAVKRLAEWAARNHLTMLGGVTGDIRTVLDALSTRDSAMVDLIELAAKLQRERDEALAVIERAKGRAHECYRSDLTCVPIEVLNTAPVDALRERDAEKWQEGRESVALDFTRPLDEAGMRKPTPNPYRETKEQSA